MNKQLTKAAKFLNQYKYIAGFDGWDIEVIDATNHDHAESFAETRVFQGAKKLQVTFYEGWNTDTGRSWKDICMHELIHARVGLIEDSFRESIEKVRYLVEERAVDDLTRGIMRSLEKR